MAVVMVMEWPEVSRDQYLQVRAELDWVTNKPDGGMLHAAGWGEDGFRVVDLWESPEHFGRFVESKLMAATEKTGIKTQPKVVFFPAEFLDLLTFKAI